MNKIFPKDLAQEINHSAFVTRHAYSGATVSNLHHYIEVPLEKDKADGLMIHIGTNDLVGKSSNQKSSEELACGMIQIGVKARKSKVEDIFISSILPTKDREANRRAKEINTYLKQYCRSHNFIYMDNGNINTDDLRSEEWDKVHLSPNGSRKLRENFAYYFSKY